MEDFKVKQSDFIGERKGKFRDSYSFGPQLGTGKVYMRLSISIGGFGEVRKCSNKKTGNIRAVKIIKKESLDSKEK